MSAVLLLRPDPDVMTAMVVAFGCVGCVVGIVSALRALGREVRQAREDREAAAQRAWFAARWPGRLF